MALRHSTISKDIEDHSSDIEMNYVCYKCPRCAWFIRFDVRDDVEYLKKVREMRHGADKFIPTVEDWSNESDEIARQLESLGYYGGR